MTKHGSTGTLCTSVRAMALSALVAIVSTSACEGGSVPESSLGADDKPNLGYALAAASDQAATGIAPELLYQNCSKRPPVVAPSHQKWFCHFGFRTPAGEQDCSTLISLQPDDHTAIWKPDWALDDSTGKLQSTLTCTPKRADPAVAA